MQLDTHTIGELTYNAGSESSMSTGIVRDTDRSYTSFSIHLGIIRSFISFNYVYKMHEKEMKLRGSVKLVLTNYFIHNYIHNCTFILYTLLYNI